VLRSWRVSRSTVQALGLFGLAAGVLSAVAAVVLVGLSAPSGAVTTAAASTPTPGTIPVHVTVTSGEARAGQRLIVIPGPAQPAAEQASGPPHGADPGPAAAERGQPRVRRA
jgi:hypothetical protein